jgi:hypothetical protein
MRTWIVFAATLLLGIGAAAAQSAKSPMQACLQEVADAREAYAQRDVGAKAAAGAEKLIEVGAHLCERENFADARKVLAVARTMLASE